MITIIDYQSGNLRSVQRACEHIGMQAVITADPAQIANAERLIFPGVGRAAQAMSVFRERKLEAPLKAAIQAGTPVLAICVGAQLILDASEEDDVQGLGLIPGQSKRFCLQDQRLKIPHMGWNEVEVIRPHPLLEHLTPGDAFYYAHAYYPVPAEAHYEFATSSHGHSFCAALGLDNLFATQFHPEKSGTVGLGLLSLFAAWDGRVPC